MEKTIFAVSDIHGHCTLLRQALSEAGFNAHDPNHLLVCCGDYFDRGTENLQVLQYLDRIENKILLRGNHEDLLLQVLQTGQMLPHNYINGTLETIGELFGKYALDAFGQIDFSGKTRVLDRVTDFILEGRDYFETAGHVFVHGWLPLRGGKIHPQWRNAYPEDWEAARWIKWLDVYESCDRIPDKTIVCGHYPTFFAHQVDSGRTKKDAGIFFGEGVTVIDAGTYSSGQLNVLVLKDSLIA